MVSLGHVGDTRGSGIVSRGVGGVYEVCKCLTRGGVCGERGEWMRGLCLGFTNPVGTGECWTCVCDLVAVVWVVYVRSG